MPVERLIPIPPSIDPISAAPMSCALGTAYRAVAVRGAVQAGMSVAIVGLGGVGIHAAQVPGRAVPGSSGSTFTSPRWRWPETSTSTPARATTTRCGAARDEIAPEGMDVVVDAVGHPRTLEATNRLVRPGGRIVAVGYSPTTDLSLPTSRLVLDELDVVGSQFAHRGDLERAIALVASGDVKPIVGASSDAWTR